MSLFVGYYRVSTTAQGKSGLGLEAQREAVLGYVKSVGGDLVDEYMEIESGSVSTRAKLAAALKKCRQIKAMLVIAKLDRLARNVYFISQLIESRVEFVAADMPTANKLTVHIIAAMAEYERDAISQRTKDALRAAKARGTVLGNPDVAALSKVGVKRKKEIADSFAETVYPKIEQLRAGGVTSLARIAALLEANGVKTPRGGQWWATSVGNALKRVENSRLAGTVAIQTSI